MLPRLLRLFAPLLLAAQTALAAGLVPFGSAVQGRLCELEVTGVPAVTNPFDPDEVAVDLEVTAPSERTWRQPAFWHQEYDRRLTAGREELTPSGTPHWRVRFWPREAGEHRLSIRIHLPNTSDELGALNLPVAPGDAGPGYVRRSPASPADFQTDDGRLLRLNGANYCWPDAQGTFTYDRWFNQLSQAGGNFARLWLAPWWAGLEHRPGTLNHYPLEEAWRLDHLFRQAEGNGIYLLLCLDHHGMYQVKNQNWGGSNNFWNTNPYSVEAGGPCASPNEFFTLEQARKTYQKRLRYLIARYGYSPRLLAWQFFNEIDNTFIQQVNADDALAWHQVMARWLRAQDPMGHLISTSMTGGSDQPLFWKLAEMDFSVYHSYEDPAPARKNAELAADFIRRYQKPMLVGEFGVDGRSWNSAIDPHLRGFRQCLWGAALGGSAGPAHSWWWESLERDHVLPLLKSFTSLMEKAGWNEGTWRSTPVIQNLVAPTELKAPASGAAPFTAVLALNNGRRLPLRGVAALPSPLAAERSSEYLSCFLYGTKNPQLASSLRLRVALGEKSRLVLKVNAVASDNQLLVLSGEKELLRTGFTNRDNLAQMNREIDQEFAVDLPAGVQTVEVRNIGYDWTGLDSLRIEGALETEFAGGWTFEPEAFALRSGPRAIVYTVAPQAVYPAGALRYGLPELEGASVRLGGWPAGRYQVSWHDPESSELLRTDDITAENNALTLHAPPFRVDLVALISAQP